MFLNKFYTKSNSFGPRVRFNWGYHDAVNEKENNRARTTNPNELHSTANVSPEFDIMYFAGYKAGLAEQNYTGNSEPAWQEYRTTLTESQLKEIYQAEIAAEMNGCRKEYIKYRMPNAIKYAKEICGYETR